MLHRLSLSQFPFGLLHCDTVLLHASLHCGNHILFLVLSYNLI
jgi:hypothetical protein